MKLSAATTHSEPRYSYEVAIIVPYDDIDMDALIELWKELALAMGFAPSAVHEAFDDSEGS